MDKDKLILNLDLARDTYLLSILSLAHFISQDELPLDKIKITLRDPETKEEGVINFDHFKSFWNNVAEKKMRQEEAAVAFRKSYINISYELVMDYCIRTKQTEIFSKQSWYPFLRALRNVASHHADTRLILWPDNYIKNGITEVKWEHYVIKKGMMGKEVKMSDINTLKLINELYTFVVNTLK